jgi:glutamyl-tRNA reductase
MLTVVGISHHTAPLDLRERVALDRDGCRALAERLGPESIVLSTCNRTELYLVGDEHAEQRAVELLTSLAGDSADQLAAVVYRYRGGDAARHLFRVAAGLDSSIMGEGEILGQLRSAYEARSPGQILERLFREALRTGRRVRIETKIAERPASVPSAAAVFVRQVLGDLGGRRVLVLGAGKMGASTARNLVSRGAKITAVASRTREHAAELAERLGARVLALDDVARELALVDVVVSSTSAPGQVIAVSDVSAAMQAREGRPLLLVDLAVPRDVDPAIGELDNCFLCNVDDLEAVVAETLSSRLDEVTNAERLVARDAERFREWLASLEITPTIVSLHALAEKIRTAELDRVSKHMDESERRELDSITARIVAKLLHVPTIRMKEAAAAGTDVVAVAGVVTELFGLDEASHAG